MRFFGAVGGFEGAWVVSLEADGGGEGDGRSRDAKKNLLAS